MKLFTKYFVLVALMAATACSGHHEGLGLMSNGPVRAEADKSVSSDNEAISLNEPPPPAPDETSPAAEDQQIQQSGQAQQAGQTSQPAQGIQRKIIRDGNITFRTDDTKRTRASIEQAVARYGGYIASDDISYLSDQTRYTLSIRIPADNFDKLLGAVAANAVRIDDKNIHARDVTEEFIDIEARLKTKKELETRYLELLHKADKVSDMLEIEGQIGTLRADIEATEGRLRYLTDQVSMSTLDVTFYDQTEKVADFGFWHRMGRALEGGWHVLLTVVVGVTHLWALIIVGLGIFFGIRYYRRKRKSKKS